MRYSEIYDRLCEPLGERAAHALTGLLEEMFEELKNSVTKSDFAELKAIVRDLGDAQKRTEERMEGLAQAQKRTEERVEELAQAQKRTEERVEELAQAQKRTEEAVQVLARQVGGLSEAVGANLEDLACDIVPELLEKHWGMEVESAGPEELPMNGNDYPFDLVVRGKTGGRRVIVLGEVKSNVTVSEVRKFLARVERVRGLLAGVEVRALFFGYRANREAREEIVAAGASMVFSRGVMI